MKFHTILLLLLLIGVSAFTVLNWNLFTSPSELSLGLTSIQMPLGLVMLGLLVFVPASHQPGICGKPSEDAV